MQMGKGIDKRKGKVVHIIKPGTLKGLCGRDAGNGYWLKGYRGGRQGRAREFLLRHPDDRWCVQCERKEATTA